MGECLVALRVSGDKKASLEVGTIRGPRARFGFDLVEDREGTTSIAVSTHAVPRSC